MKSGTIISLLLFILISFNIYAHENKKPFAVFRDSLDNAMDISDFLLNKKDF